MPADQAGFFGGGAFPYLDTANMRELVMYDTELADECLTTLHDSLVRRHITSVLSPPPPVPVAGNHCTAEHVPYISSVAPQIYYDLNGTYGDAPGLSRNVTDNIRNPAALYTSAWTFSIVVGNGFLDQLGRRTFIRDSNSSLGLGQQGMCGEVESGYSCAGGNKELDRGSCSRESLFGAYHSLCATSTGANCPYVVAERRGPGTGEVTHLFEHFTLCSA